MAFLLKDDGTPVSPKSVERRRRLGEAMMSEGMNTAPIQSWTQGAARLANAFFGSLNSQRADEAEEQGQRSAREAVASALGLGGPATVPAARSGSGAAKVADAITGPSPVGAPAQSSAPASPLAFSAQPSAGMPAPLAPTEPGSGHTAAAASPGMQGVAPRAPSGGVDRAALYSAMQNPWLSDADRQTVMFELRRREDDARRVEDQARWQQEFTANQGYRNRSIALQERQYEQGRVPAGYRSTSAGLEPIPGGPADPNIIAKMDQAKPPAGYRATSDGYEAIPGGPADPKVIEANRLAQAGAQAPATTEMYDPATGRKQRAQYNPTTRAWEPIGGVEVPVKKPVPPAVMKMENDDLGDIQNTTQINDMLSGFKKQLESGALQLGPVANTISAARNWMGTSTPETRNFASFQAGLEKLRNDSLRLNKGVQTEGDAQRAWNELLANINDPALVAQRLDEIMRLNEQAAQFKMNVIQQRRAEYSLDPLDVNSIVARQPGAKDQGQVPQGTAQQQTGGNIPSQAVQALQQNPQLAQQFDAKYGPGAAARALGAGQ